jgi:DNA-binding response OmpR family regulator
LDVFITRLRKYISQDPSVKLTNVHGVGFRLEV